MFWIPQFLKRFNFKCNKCECEIKDNTYEIDHIRPLANGGTNKANNLQPLCKACHKDKCMNEHENGEYIKVVDSESTFNNNIRAIIDSNLAQSHAFIETIVKRLTKKGKYLLLTIINL